MSGAKSLAITFLRTLTEGVSWPEASVKSVPRMRNLRIDSGADTALFASSTACWISAISSGWSARSRVAAGRRRCSRLPEKLQRLGIQRHQAGDIAAAFADHHALADQRVRADPVLEHSGRDVRAAGGDDQVLVPARDPQEALLV